MESNNKCILYIGSYTQKPPDCDNWLRGEPDEKSIRSYMFNPNDGSLSLLKEYDTDFAGINCIYMATTKNGNYLYVVNHIINKKESDITAFKIDKNNPM